MEIGLIAAPVIGAVIGYCTNYIAVKMLFRPYNEKHIGSLKIPFTPGIIPKGKPRIARAVANTVGETLLTEEDLKERLSDIGIKEALWEKCREKLEELKQNQVPVLDYLEDAGMVEDKEKLLAKTEATISGKIMSRLMTMNLGQLASEKIIEIGGEYLQGSLIGSFLGPNVLLQFSEPIETKVNQLVEGEGYEMIKDQVSCEIEDLGKMPLGRAITRLLPEEERQKEFILGIYDKLLDDGLGKLLAKIDIKNIIEKKINLMDPKELETLTFAVMKKELNAIINLGALIGFILGCINLIFLG